MCINMAIVRTLRFYTFSLKYSDQMIAVLALNTKQNTRIFSNPFAIVINRHI